jgi:hypothetical protein
MLDTIQLKISDSFFFLYKNVKIKTCNTEISLFILYVSEALFLALSN